MNKKLLSLLMSCMIVAPLTMIAAEKPLEEAEASITPTAPAEAVTAATTETAVFNPQIWPDGGKQWIFDSMKWSVSKIEDELTAWHLEIKDQLNEQQEPWVKNAEISINEIVGWLQDKTIEERKVWQAEFFGKMREFEKPLGIIMSRYPSVRKAISKEQFQKLAILHSEIIQFNRRPVAEDIDIICNMLRLNNALLKG